MKCYSLSALVLACLSGVAQAQVTTSIRHGGYFPDWGDIHCDTPTNDSGALRIGGGRDVQVEHGSFITLFGNQRPPDNGGHSVAGCVRLYAGNGGSIALLNGNVGIGTADPKDKLSLGYGDSFSFDVTNPNQITRLRWRYGGEEVTWIERVHDTGDMVFGNQRVERMRIDRFGNVGIGTLTPEAKLDVGGKLRCEVLEVTSDRNAKTNFKSLNLSHELEKLAALEISEWEYTNAPGVRHYGAMAQDFHRAFGLGSDDKHINPLDAASVALAGVQALTLELKEKDAQIADLKSRLERMDRQLAANSVLMEKLMGQLPPAAIETNE